MTHSMDESVLKMMDIIRHPEKYGKTREELNQWVFDNVKVGSGLIGDIPEDLGNELADALISVYKAKLESTQCRQDEQPLDTASPTQPDAHGESDP